MLDGRAPVIRSDVPQSFPWRVLTQRHPALLDQVGAGHPYPPRIAGALARLRATLSDVIPELPADTPDRTTWQQWGRDLIGQRWLDVPFHWAESYFYRLLLDAVEYFRPGPWRGIDPFAPQKAAELHDPALDAELAALDAVADLPAPRRTAALLHAALWGNRADLGFLLSNPSAAQADTAGVIVDDSAAIVALLRAGTGPVCVIADNAARELVADLALIDQLLSDGLTVDLHLKPSPYFVSDATTADLLATLPRLPAGPRARLSEALRSGALTLTAHEFYCAPLTFHDAPEDLATRFAAARLTLCKGDLNYRRLIGDRHWPAATPFDETTAYFPGAVATLRTLKSEVVVGIDPAAERALAARTPDWRIAGTHALIQLRAT
jgi:hypothetical protein